jgi:hypothetical protein
MFGKSHSRFRNLSLMLAHFLLVIGHSLEASAATYTVNSMSENIDFNLADNICDTGFLISGMPECTLRAAIEQSNISPSSDTIAFWSGLPVDMTGSTTFTPTNAYSSIKDDVIIDGYTASGYDTADPWALPVINIDGSSLPAEPWGIRFLPPGNSSTIRGIGIVNWNGDGIRIGFSGFPSQLLTIQGCHIGVLRGAAAGNSGSGIRHVIDPVWNVQNVIGQVCARVIGCTGKGNVISNNGVHGIWLGGNDNVVAGNRIGTSVDGMSAMGNAQAGIHTGTGSNNEIGSVVEVAGVEESSGNLISGNSFWGIFFEGTGGAAYANRIGTNAPGTAAIPNGLDGIAIADGDHVLGAVGERANLVSGNLGRGIVFGTLAGNNNDVVGNRIGVDQNGAVGIPNGGDGIQIAGGQCVVSDNLIGSNGGDGIEIATNANLILDNYIGTNPTGTDLGNQGIGIHVVDGSNNDIQGSTTGNVIGFNDTGILLSSLASLTYIADAYIGTNASGANLGNDNDGIEVDGNTNQIGDTALGASAGNIIGWNGGNGVTLDGPANIIWGNYIGTDTSGAGMPNGVHGIDIRSRSNEVGATASTAPASIPDLSNLIAFNTRAGVNVINDGSTNNPIRGNSIHDNGALGIDLDPAGVTPNDPGDPDSGPNHRQNHPEIVVGSVDWDLATSQLTVRYSVDSLVSSSTYPLEIDFYLADASLREGEIWLGRDSYPVPSVLTTLFLTTVVAVPNGSHLVATATDSAGGIGSTSEFSPPEPVPEPGGWSLTVGALALAWLRRRN